MANGTIAASQLEMLSQSGTGIITITPPATNTNRAITLPDAAGAIVVSGTTPSLNGITFPATQVASAGANTLDDYEEGTWTPAYVPADGGSVTMSIQSGRYAKIGNTVFVSCRLNTTSISSPVGTVKISGLPFTPLSGDLRYAFSVADARGWGVSFSPFTAIVESSDPTITLTKQATNAGFLGVNSTDLSGSDGGNLVSIAGFYTV